MTKTYKQAVSIAETKAGHMASSKANCLVAVHAVVTHKDWTGSRTQSAELSLALAQAYVDNSAPGTVKMASARRMMRDIIKTAQTKECAKWVKDLAAAESKGEASPKPPKLDREKARDKATAKAKNTNPPKKGGARGPQTGGSGMSTKDPAEIIRNQMRTDVKRAANHAQNQAVAIAACLQTVGGLSGKDKAKALAQLEAIREHNVAFADDITMLAGSI